MFADISSPLLCRRFAWCPCWPEMLLRSLVSCMTPKSMSMVPCIGSLITYTAHLTVELDHNLGSDKHHAAGTALFRSHHVLKDQTKSSRNKTLIVLDWKTCTRSPFDGCIAVGSNFWHNDHDHLGILWDYILQNLAPFSTCSIIPKNSWVSLAAWLE